MDAVTSLRMQLAESRRQAAVRAHNTRLEAEAKQLLKRKMAALPGSALRDDMFAHK